MDVDFLLFYDPMRYELATLKTSSFAWKKNEGVTKAHGTLFPFVSKSKRENPKKQLIAYQRLLQYQKKKQQLALENKVKILTNKETLIQEKYRLIEKQEILIKHKDEVIQDKVTMIQKLYEELNQNNIKIDTIMSAIQKVTDFPIRKNPIHKYKAYKMMLKTYYQVKSSK